MKQIVNDENKDKIVRIPDVVHQKTETDSFLLSQLPMSLNISNLYDVYINADSLSEEDLNCLIHDLVLYKASNNLTEEIFYSTLKRNFNAHPFIVKLKEVIKSDARKSLSYGSVVRWIQNNTTTVPTPRSWELKEEQIINILYEWICFFDKDFVVEVPGRKSEVICYCPD